MNIFCDLDSVLCDFDSQAHQICPEALEIDQNIPWSKLTPQQKAVKRKLFDGIKATKGDFWRRLSKLPGADELWYYLMSGDDNIYILTSPIISDPYCNEAKRAWCLGNLFPPPRLVFVEPNKAIYAKQKMIGASSVTFPNVLIDDRHSNITAWQEAGGIGILFENTDQTIRDLNILKTKEND